MTGSDHPVVCVATRSHDKPTETFIRNHIERLPLPTVLLTGDRLDRTEDGLKLGSASNARKWRSRVQHRKWDIGHLYYPDDVAAYFRRRCVDVVLAEYGTAGAMIADTCEYAGVPLVVHFHGYDASRRTHIDRYREKYRAMFERAAAVISVSGHMTEQLIWLGARRERVHEIPYGVDLDDFADADPAQAPAHLLSVGRFVEKKSPHLVLLAFQKVLAEHPDARLTMVGDGPLLPIVRDLATVLGLTDSIELTGELDNADVASWMRRARCFVQHSVEASDGDCEGSPVAILEAAASGLPIVATRHAGIVQSVVEGETGFLVDERDVDGMSRAMGSVLADPDLASRLGASGRAHVSSNYAMANQLIRLADVLTDAALGTPDMA